MFLSKPSGSHIWSKDSNEFPFSFEGCINQSFSCWWVSSWFSSENPSLSKYPKANHMGGRGIKKIQNRPHCSWNSWMFVAKLPCAKIPLPFIQSWQPMENILLLVPISHFHEKQRKGYTIPCLWEEESFITTLIYIYDYVLIPRHKTTFLSYQQTPAWVLRLFLLQHYVPALPGEDLRYDWIRSSALSDGLLFFHTINDPILDTYSTKRSNRNMSLLLSYHLPLLQIRGKCWVHPPPTNSHHQDDYIFSQQSTYTVIVYLYLSLWLGGGHSQYISIYIYHTS